ncbi:MAG TPA: hypothetical protein VG165_01995 [Solirubrobacteraceae bacterium]|jgi:hypothetical protein|nr:hypothetical protein [Solirubrobacteraceae bacterium]
MSLRGRRRRRTRVLTVLVLGLLSAAGALGVATVAGPASASASASAGGALGVATVAGAGPASTSASGSTWSPPAGFAPVSVSTDGAAIAFDAGGDAAIAWLEPDGRAAARVRPAGRGFGPTATLSGAKAPVYGAPLAAVDPRGDATVLWISEIAGRNSYRTEVQAAAQPAGRSFGRPQTVFDQPGGATVSDAGLGVDDRGRATAFWIDAADDVVHVATRSAAGTAWSAPTTIANPADAAPSSPQYAVAANGDAVVAWGGARQGVYVSVRRGQRRFGPARLIDPDAFGGGLVAIDPRGEAILIWADCKTPECGTDTFLDYAVRRPGAAGFSAPQMLTPDSVDAIAATFDTRGDVTVAWSPAYPSLAATGQAGGVVAAVRPNGGSFGPVEILAPDPGEFMTACDDTRGNAYVAWRTESSTGTFSELSTTIPSTGRPVAPGQTISRNTATDQPFSGPSLACGKRGATAVWAANGPVGQHLDLTSTPGPA